MLSLKPFLTAALAATILLASAARSQDGRRHDGGYRHGLAPGRSAPPSQRGPAPRRAWSPERRDVPGYFGGRAANPPPSAYGPGAARPGVGPWRRGGYLPAYYHGAVIEDYARYRLRRPPFGYRWVYAGGDYMLVATSSGLIFDVVPGR